MGLAIMMANAGGAWDNSKKLCEKLGLKKKAPDLQKACVVGDTVGDPFKDTSGPALNILTLGDCIRLYTKEKEANEDWVCPADKEVVPDSDKCVEISTRSSVQEMVAPGAYAVLAPLIGGFLVGPRFLMGMLAGAIASGCMLAIMMANAGGAWDNSKKLCEKLKLKKSKDEKEREQQKACVVGDTVGDPFKDTSGPALNILIKLMSMVSLTVAPL